MDNFDSLYSEFLASNSSKNYEYSRHNLTYDNCVLNENENTCNELNKSCVKYSLQSEYNNAHMSPVDKLIAKNQQKMKRNSINSPAKKTYLTRQQENINKQNKSVKTSIADTNDPPKIPPRNRKINWSEKFKERRRSRRLSNLPPICEIKKEIVTEEYSELYDETSYNIIATNIKDEKVIKNEIEDTYSDNFQQENYSNLDLNMSPDPNELSNNYLPQQDHFIENNEIFESTGNDTLNSFTYSGSQISSLETIDNEQSNFNLTAKHKLNTEIIDNNEQQNLGLVDKVWSTRFENNKQTHFDIIFEEVLDSESDDNIDNEQVDFNLLNTPELIKQTTGNAETNIYSYPYENTNIQESDSFSPKILECWSIKNSEKHLYSQLEEDTYLDEINYENIVLEKSLPANNSDLDEVQNTLSPYENNSKSSSLFNRNCKLKSSTIASRSVPQKINSNGKINTIKKLVSSKNTNITTNTNPFYLQTTYFEKTFKPILPKPSPKSDPISHSEIDIPKLYSEIKNLLSSPKMDNLKSPDEINNLKLQQIDPKTIIEEPVLADDKVVEEIPILQRKYSDMTIEEKKLYREKLNFVTALELVPINELKNKCKEVKENTIMESNRNSFYSKVLSLGFYYLYFFRLTFHLIRYLS